LWDPNHWFAGSTRTWFASTGQVHRLAEDTGLILNIGDFVLRDACARTRAWHDRGLSGLRIAVKYFRQTFFKRRIFPND